jgi:hypothetical protein
MDVINIEVLQLKYFCQASLFILFSNSLARGFYLLEIQTSYKREQDNSHVDYIKGTKAINQKFLNNE